MDVQPFERTGLLTRAAPFLLAITAAFALTPMQPYGSRAHEILYAVAVASAIVAAVVFVPWNRLPRFAQSAPALGFFGVVALLSGAGGGPSSVYAPLVFLPVVWIALYGERWELGFAIMGVAATFLGPLVRSAHYPATEVGRSLAAVAVAVVVGVTVQGLVRRLRARAEESANQAEVLRRSQQHAEILMANMAAVSQLTREVARTTDISAARVAVCAAARLPKECSADVHARFDSPGCRRDPGTVLRNCRLDGYLRCADRGPLPGRAITGDYDRCRAAASDRHGGRSRPGRCTRRGATTAHAPSVLASLHRLRGDLVAALRIRDLRGAAVGTARKGGAGAEARVERRAELLVLATTARVPASENCNRNCSCSSSRYLTHQ
jgi:hypothetical protein